VLREQSFTPLLPGGQYVDSRAGRFFMIAFAYNIRRCIVQLTGLPGWAKNQSLDVRTQPPQGFPMLHASENGEQVRLMMHVMLADRFHLQLHSETRQEQVFALEVARGGIKIPETPAPIPPEKAKKQNGN
jgi:uncharacterized protein (TIGR03435 family)